VLEIFKKDPETLYYYQQKFKYIMVDEVQDLNQNQQQWLMALVSDRPEKLSCVGDDDQMIYGFRGANGEFIMKFKEIYPSAKFIRLEQNYRSTKNILDAANNLISHNKLRHGKVLWTSNAKGDPVRYSSYADRIDECR
jgi:DNA helicase-2/ATP-dependent DNA helicase PcrA